MKILENGESPVTNCIDVVNEKQNEIVLFKDDIDFWVESNVIQFPISEESPSSSKLYKSFEGFCSQNGIKSYSSFNQFCRQLYPKLKSMGFDWQINEHRHNGTIWALNVSK